jgi:hypothetical protein
MTVPGSLFYFPAATYKGSAVLNLLFHLYQVLLSVAAVATAVLPNIVSVDLVHIRGTHFVNSLKN